MQGCRGRSSRAASRRPEHEGGELSAGASSERACALGVWACVLGKIGGAAECGGGRRRADAGLRVLAGFSGCPMGLAM